MYDGGFHVQKNDYDYTRKKGYCHPEACICHQIYKLSTNVTTPHSNKIVFFLHCKSKNICVNVSRISFLL